jgi:hypothetical protein
MCCGRSATGFFPPPAARRAVPNGFPAPVVFERIADGPLTMFGRTTGLRYHFPERGARVRVDGRDAPVLELVRGLTPIVAVAARGD